MDIQIGKRKFVVMQTWPEMTEFTDATDDLDDEMFEAKEAKDRKLVRQIGKRIAAAHEAQVVKCLKTVNGEPWDGNFAGLEHAEVAGIVLRLLNPMMELVNRVPFDNEPSNV